MLTITSSKPGFQYVNPGVAYIDTSNGNLANSPKNLTLYFNKISGAATDVSVTISKRNSTFPASQYATVTIASLNIPSIYTITDLAYGETEFKVEASVTGDAVLALNYTCFGD